MPNASFGMYAFPSVCRELTETKGFDVLAISPDTVLGVFEVRHHVASWPWFASLAALAIGPHVPAQLFAAWPNFPGRDMLSNSLSPSPTTMFLP